MKYPTVTIGAVASSAPVEAVLDFWAYNAVVNNSFTFVAGPECDARIRQATDAVQTLLQTSSGVEELEKLFKVCSPMQSPKDIENFMSSLMGNFEGVVQYNDDNRDPISREIDINYICNMMTNASVDALTAYVNVNNLILNVYGMPCLDASYQDLVAQTSNSTPPNDAKSWTYQTCVEFGYFQTTDSDEQPFGNQVPLSFYTGLCSDVFGIDPNTIGANINQTNINYGGNNIPPNGPTNILFVNGDIDPWHALGIYETISWGLQAIFIIEQDGFYGGAHCSNVYADSPNDSSNLRWARVEINDWIGLQLASNMQ